MLFKRDKKKNGRVQTTSLLRGFGRRQKFQNVITARNGVTVNNRSYEGEERRLMPMMDVGVFEGGPNIFFALLLRGPTKLFVCLGLRRRWSCSCLVCRARAIGYRQHNREAVGGFFSQIGNLYMVHHLWGTAQNDRVCCHADDRAGSFAVQGF